MATFVPAYTASNQSTGTGYTVATLYDQQCAAANTAGSLGGPAAFGQGMGSFGQLLVNVPPNQQWVQVQQQMALPNPTQSYTAIGYTDPVSGLYHVIHVDNAYYQIIHDIISIQSTCMPSVTVTTVPEGEFSLDEIGQAEDLIEEIEHAN